MVVSEEAKVNESKLMPIVRAAVAAHPSLAVDERAFLLALEQRLASQDAPPSEANAGDMLLAYACSQGPAGSHAAAAALFERLYGGVVRSALSRFRLGGDREDEVAQLVRERLFVSRAGAPPKIAEYAGRGPLAAWLRAVVARVALDVLRRGRAPGDAGPRDADEELQHAAGALGDPELEVLLSRYREPFKEAFQATLASLPARDRTLLRFAIVDGMNVDALGALHGVHRATAARWVAQAREALAIGTREKLSARFRLTRTELDSITRLCRSQVDVSLVRLLATRA